MLTRRNFLQNSLLGAAFLQNSPLFANNSENKNHPLVLTTWNNFKASQVAWDMLAQGALALDAVEQGLRVPEADPEDTSVGYGGMPDRDGHVTLDACIMDEKGRAGSVTYLQNIMHPISVARKVMENTPHVILSGEGALQFARNQGFIEENLLTEKAKEAWEDWLKKNEYTPKITPHQHDTCGMLTIDKTNNMSGGCTTSGWAFKLPGRVGDSPIIGAGLFVDNEFGGATGTGLGELSLRTLGCFLAVEFMRNGKCPQKACELVVKRIVDKYGTENQMCFIAADKKGNYGGYAIQKGFQYFVQNEGKAVLVNSGSYVK